MNKLLNYKTKTKNATSPIFTEIVALFFFTNCQRWDHNTTGQYLNTALLFQFKTYLISRIHPSGASIRPIWIPVNVSYNFCVIGPIFSIPLGKIISLP